MQLIVELLTALMVWLAAAVLAQFGVDVDIEHPVPPAVERVIEHNRAETPLPVAEACPEARKDVRGRPVKVA